MPKVECLEYLAVAGSTVTFYKGETYEVPAAILKDHAAYFSKVAKTSSTKDASKASEDK